MHTQNLHNTIDVQENSLMYSSVLIQTAAALDRELGIVVSDDTVSRELGTSNLKVLMAHFINVEDSLKNANRLLVKLVQL